MDATKATKHTPGPWISDFGTGTIWRKHSALDGPATHLPRIADAVRRDEDARLIAAAPELLAACEAVLEAISRADLGGTVLWIEPPYQIACVHETATERLQAAIAKAKGE